jgi:hypothetical protein
MERTVALPARPRDPRPRENDRPVAFPARPSDPHPRESHGAGRVPHAPATRARGTSYALVKTAWMVMRLCSDIMFSRLNDMP